MIIELIRFATMRFVLQYIPKTTMNFAGFKSPQDRADVIAYLAKATSE